MLMTYHKEKAKKSLGFRERMSKLQAEKSLEGEGER